MRSMQLLPYKQQVSSLLRLGLPIVVGQLGMIILGLADTIMIGHHSTEELAAAAFVNNVFNLAIIFATGFSYGFSSNRYVAGWGKHTRDRTSIS